MGAGAVGAYYAALMAKQAPEDVLLLARHESFEAIRRLGVTLQGPLGVQKTRVQVTEDPSTISGIDYVINTVKMYDLEQSLAETHDVIRNARAIFGLQNGIEKEAIFERHTLRKPLQAVTYVSSEKVAPGVISFTAEEPRVCIGEEGNERSSRVLEIQRLLNDSGIKCSVPPNIQDEVWGKFVYGCPILGVCAAARCDLGTAASYGPTRRLLVDALQEGLVVASAQGFEFTDQRRKRYLENVTDTSDPARPSMLVDVLKGRKTEVDYLNGALVRKAAERGLRVPVNEFLHAVISAPKLAT